MKVDEFGSCIYQDYDIFDLIYRGVSDFDNIQVEMSDEISTFIDLSGIKLVEYKIPAMSIGEFDQKNQRMWLIPEHYHSFDIYEYCIENCNTDQQLERCLSELILYEKLKLLPILNVLKYIVDTLRENNIVWGVGRGSSVSSYVLYKLGVHRVDSLKYDLDYTEFLRVGE